MNEKRNRENIETIARGKLKEYGMYGVPVDPAVLANRMGINVATVIFSDNDVSGMMRKTGDTVRLYINNSDNPYRQRFTVAHELGHVVLHLNDFEEGDYPERNISMFRNNSNIDPGDRYKETEANQFAAALLMDEELVKDMWEKFKSLKSMADAFEVSKEAMAYRLGNLGL